MLFMDHMTMPLPCNLQHMAIPLELFLNAHLPLSARTRSESQGRCPLPYSPPHKPPPTLPHPCSRTFLAFSFSNSFAFSSGPMGQSASTLKGFRLLQGARNSHELQTVFYLQKLQRQEVQKGPRQLRCGRKTVVLFILIL